MPKSTSYVSSFRICGDCLRRQQTTILLWIFFFFQCFFSLNIIRDIFSSIHFQEAYYIKKSDVAYNMTMQESYTFLITSFCENTNGINQKIFELELSLINFFIKCKFLKYF